MNEPASPAPRPVTLAYFDGYAWQTEQLTPTQLGRRTKQLRVGKTPYRYYFGATSAITYVANYEE